MQNDDCIANPDDLVLVTGSSGFIGTRVVKTLIDYGLRNIRCFVRPSSRLDSLNRIREEAGSAVAIDVFTGDLLSEADCARAVSGVSVVVHLAAGFDKSFAGAFMNSALSTRNLIEAFADEPQRKRFVNVSSFSVYANLQLKRGALMDESCELEDAHQTRNDSYGFGKLKQEQIVKEIGESKGVPYVILRPGAVFGPGKKALSGRIGIDTFGFMIQIGGGQLVPLTYVDNCAEAIVLSALKSGVEREVFNVVDDELLTARQFLKAYKRALKKRFSIWIPYSLGYALCCLWEDYSKRTKGQLPPAFNRQRCAAEWRSKRFSNDRLKSRLGWKPRVGMEEAMSNYLQQYKN